MIKGFINDAIQLFATLLQFSIDANKETSPAGQMRENMHDGKETKADRQIMSERWLDC